MVMMFMIGIAAVFFDLPEEKKFVNGVLSIIASFLHGYLSIDYYYEKNKETTSGTS